MGPWIDATRILTEGIVQWPDDLAFTRRRVLSIEAGDPCNLSELHSSAHVGTHIDAPAHFIAGGPTIDRIPLDILCGPAGVIQVEADDHFTADDLERAGAGEHERVLLKTCNEALWEKPAFETGYLALTPEAARWLVDRGTKLIGIDYLSVDPFEADDSPVHHILLGAGVIILEGVNLADVPIGRYEMIALPLRLAGSDGSPARVILRSGDA